MTTTIKVGTDGDVRTLKDGLARAKNLGGKPYTLQLKAGQDFSSEGYWVPVTNGTVTRYGTGSNPKVAKPRTMGASTAVEDFTITGLDLTDGVSFVGPNKRVSVIDNIIRKSKLTIDSWEGQPEDFIVRRNIFPGAYCLTSSYTQDDRPSNMYSASCQGYLIIEENVFDYGGWHPTLKGASANMYNHNIYLQASNNGNGTVVRNNIIVRGSSHGVQMRAGGVCEDNYFGRNAIGILMGYDQKPLKAGVKATVRNNIVQEGHSMIKGVNPGEGPNLITGARYGIHFDVNGDAKWECHNNLVSHISTTDTQTIRSFITRGFSGIDNAAVKHSGNEQFEFGSSTLSGVKTLTKAPRTLADYASHIGVSGGFEGFMDKVLSRKFGEWDTKYTAKAINAFITGTAVATPAPEPTPSPQPTPPPTTGGKVVLIEAESFSNFHDKTPEQLGDGEGPVDTIDLGGGNSAVGWTDPGEWLEYYIEHNVPAIYNLSLRVASDNSGPKTIRVAIDGGEAATFIIEGRGWTNYFNTEAQPVAFSRGKRKIRVVFVTGGVNLDSVHLDPISSGETITLEVIKEVIKEVTPANAQVVTIGSQKMAIWPVS